MGWDEPAKSEDYDHNDDNDNDNDNDDHDPCEGMNQPNLNHDDD